MKSIDIAGEFHILITVTEDAPVDIFERAADPDFPYWNAGPDGERLPMQKSQLIDHLTHNALVNGISDISDLDGFGDFPWGSVTMRVDDTGVDRWLAK